jgi:AAA+ superfamily predicted ATPase
MARQPSSVNPARDLQQDLRWLQAFLDAQIKLYFRHEDAPASFSEVAAPSLAAKGGGAYGQFFRAHKLNDDERLVLLLALAPHVKPELLDVFYGKNGVYDRRFTEFGGRYGEGHAGFIATVETAYFVLTGGDLARRIECSRIFSPDHVFATQGIFKLERDHEGEPLTSSRLIATQDAAEMLVLGRTQPPEFGEHFPARKLTTAMEFQDLVLRPDTVQQIEEIIGWTQHHQRIMEDWGLKRRLAPGYKAMFYGPPGTGKTLAAALLGKATGKEVYRVDLALTVSKWIGETEKNLAGLFEKATNKDWILFFDEADALFGKRTEVKDAHDRFANQEVAYLLQRIEEFPGLVLLASNLSQNVDPAFRRRFQAIIHFPMPTAPERLTLWQNAFPPAVTLAPEIDLPAIARKHEVAGGFIVNVVRSCCLSAARSDHTLITAPHFHTALRREFHKEGIMMQVE